VKVRGNAEADGGNVPPPQLDDVDLEILRLLRVDARRSARAIARDVGMSPGAVNERLTRLENFCVIRPLRFAISFRSSSSRKKNRSSS
jgi:DNA-binding Lrp family transcriptional regulator